MTNKESIGPFMAALVILIGLIGINFKLKNDISKLTDVESITLSREFCTNKCIEHTLSIASDGAVSFYGDDREFINTHKAVNIGIEGFDRVKRAIKEIDFYTLTTNYSEPGKHNIIGQCIYSHPDVDRMKISVKSPLGINNVSHRLACSVLPVHKRFSQLGEFIDKIAVGSQDVNS